MLTKTCTKCLECKAINLFSVRKDAPCGYRSWCKECIKNRSNAHYSSNKSIYRERSRRRKVRIRELIKEYKNKPCLDCGILYPYFVMEFDHRPTEQKIFEVSRWQKQSCGIKGILEEIEKCDVVCSNCHRARTHIRKYGKLPPFKN